TTSLVLMALASGTALAQESGVATLPAVQVQADGDPTTTEGTGSYTSGATSIAKGAQSLRDIPQSISVVTRQRLDEQSRTSI
ncbi:TonB-dependent siderophore receptor, partial [Burkholderia sp. SIMBA_013]